jgi:hypothetical protein
MRGVVIICLDTVAALNGSIELSGESGAMRLSM